MMSFITRDENGHINGVFANQQFPEQEYLEGAELWSDPKATINAQITVLLQSNGLMQPWQVESAMAGMLGFAASQGINEPTLYATNPGYKTAKDLDAKIKELQAQL